MLAFTANEFWPQTGIFFFKSVFPDVFKFMNCKWSWDLQRKTFRKSSKEAIKEPLVRTDEEKSGWLG